eukprot:Protomagalhaensia_wolfi_Nauph_80__2425@NODE_2601_length_1042_cov_49_602193_g2036_i0_p1_GENE_NODE_2601_length_1042_cov_49_602193_g2036_i0NODE_2601_length_1042_cov_49_602193_g2036_i0_p1_ORF_typecomplete_len221_score27_63Yip1/PF04893_17/3_3e05_NODE_2601_length_1042_cov_49_602193_g2036_i0332994
MYPPHQQPWQPRPPLQSPFPNVQLAQSVVPQTVVPSRPQFQPPEWYSDAGSVPGIPGGAVRASPPLAPAGGYPPPVRETPFDTHALTGSNSMMAGSNAPAPSSSMPATVEVDDELPLLDELGIYPGDICRRMVSVLLCKSLEHDLLAQLDMSGPTMILLSLGCMLLLAGKIHFGYIYALSTCGSFGLWILLNLMSKKSLIYIEPLAFLDIAYCQLSFWQW